MLISISILHLSVDGVSIIADRRMVEGWFQGCHWVRRISLTSVILFLSFTLWFSFTLWSSRLCHHHCGSSLLIRCDNYVWCQCDLVYQSDSLLFIFLWFPFFPGLIWFKRSELTLIIWFIAFSFTLWFPWFIPPCSQLFLRSSNLASTSLYFHIW